MLEKIKKTIKNHSMLAYGATVIVGVSGGPDSTALLAALSLLSKEYGLKLFAVHINYHLRGAESNGDQKFCENLCRRLRVPFEAVQADFSRGKKGGSIQDAARNFRYMVFSVKASESKAACVAVAHNRDDQVETMLMRFLRGSGTEGLAGIPPTRELSRGVRLIRPMIDIPRKDIEKFLAEKKFRARQDSSNRKELYLRNKIRLRLIPLLKREYNRGFDEAAIRLIRILNEENSFLAEASEKAFNRLKVTGDGCCSFACANLNVLHPALLKRVLRAGIEQVKGDLTGLEFQHFEKIAEILCLGRGKADLPGNVAAQVHSGKLYLRMKSGEKQDLIPLVFPGITKTGRFKIRAVPGRAPSAFKGPSHAYIDLKKISLPLCVRSRRAADRFTPLGMKGKKKLQDFFVDLKLPEFERDAVPVVVDGTGKVVWVAGYRIDDTVKITKKTEEVIHLVLLKA